MNVFFVLGASNLLIHFFALKHMPLADANMIGMGSRVAPDTELAGYPVICLPDIRYPAK